MPAGVDRQLRGPRGRDHPPGGRLHAHAPSRHHAQMFVLLARQQHCLNFLCWKYIIFSENFAIFAFNLSNFVHLWT